MSLRTRILLLVLLATLAPALAIGLYFMGERDRDIDEATLSLGALAKSTSENLDDKVKGTVQLLHGLSRAPDIDTGDRAACSEFLAGVLARYPQYTGLLTITPKGELHCDSLRTGRKLHLSKRGYFMRVLATREPAFEVVIGGLTGLAVLQVAYPVLDPRGALRYVVLASLNLSEYAQGVVAANPSKNLRLLIWDRKGVLLVRKPEAPGAAHVGMDGSATDLFRFAASAAPEAAIVLPDLDNTPRVWAAGVMLDASADGARLVLGIPRGRLVADANRDLYAALAMLAAVSLLAFAAAWYVAETGIRRHVRLIAAVAKRVGQGDLGARGGPPYARGELGELMEVVDRTAAAVQSQREKIVSGSRDLGKLNRVLRVLSGINSLIVRVQGRDELLREACRVAVEAGAFRMAWIGMIDPRTLEGRVIAMHGGEDGYVDLVRLTARAGLPESDRPACRALREATPVICNDIAADSGLEGLREELLARGHRSVGCFPLLVGGKVAGVMALFASEVGAFDAEETRLLVDLSVDISFALDHLEKQDRLDYLAYYDALTGLANRTLFLDRAGQALDSAASGGHELAILLVDLERFRNINDSLGRATGDALLRDVGQWLAPAAGAANLVGRVGADQFAVILPKVRAGGSFRHFLEKRLAELREHAFHVDGAVLRVAIKVGVAVYPGDGTDAETLLRNAEAALKKAKATGERYLFHTLQMTEAAAGQLTLENRLREAWEKGELVLHYQAKVSLPTGKLVGAEALVRWSDPRTGPVPPEVFLPALEEMGLLVEVGRWALRQAVGDYLRWKGQGLAEVRIGVNLSSSQLRHRNMLAELAEALAAGADAAGGLEVEVAEGLVMEDVKHSIQALEALRAMGVRVAIDDFGTGFSSLSQLARLPADTLKVDRSFVADMTTGPKGLALVSTIIGLAHSLKLQVVAQGVETEEQSRLLGLLGCDAAQGGLIGAPLPADAFEARFLRAPPP